ncbi:hypothetical protein MHYP_G00182870 [Metynnis hypsauchen]
MAKENRRGAAGTGPGSLPPLHPPPQSPIGAGWAEDRPRAAEASSPAGKAPGNAGLVCSIVLPAMSTKVQV